jgi:hypothetical protein
MKKNILLDFIKKYSLNDTIEKCRWVSNSKDKTLKTSVAADTKNLLVDLTLSNWDGFGDAEVGVGNTSKFKRELGGIYGEDVSFVINYSDDKSRIISIDVMDGESVGTFTTSDLDMIAQSSKMKGVPPFNAEIVFDSELKERFLKAKAALPDVDGFTVMMNKKGVLELVVGFSNINSSKYSLKVKTVGGKDTVDEPLHFNANYMKEILNANSECGDATLSVSDNGLASISFTSNDFNCKYFLTPIDQD